MLKMINNMKDLDFGKLMCVYSDSNLKDAQLRYPDEEENIGILNVEQENYRYLKEMFFPISGAFCAVWEQGGTYVSALRVEPCRDGLLLTGLETAPAYRRRGYASSLLRAVAAALHRQGGRYLYSHVAKNNQPSLKTHFSCGFERFLEHAVYLDGSVTQDSCTLRLMISK